MKNFFAYIDRVFSTAATFMMAVLSENGFPSSSRFLMVLFSFATIRILFIIIHHLTSLHDVGILGIWLGNLPIIIATLIGLISTPYAINKGTTSLGQIVGMITAAKSQPPASDTDKPSDLPSQTNIIVKN